MDDHLDTSWCPVCEKLIPPKKYLIPIIPQCPPLDQMPPLQPSTSTGVVRQSQTTRGKHGTIKATRGHQRGGLVNGTGRGGVIARQQQQQQQQQPPQVQQINLRQVQPQAVQPQPQVKYRTVVDQGPTPLYCSEECRLADVHDKTGWIDVPLHLTVDNGFVDEEEAALMLASRSSKWRLQPLVTESHPHERADFIDVHPAYINPASRSPPPPLATVPSILRRQDTQDSQDSTTTTDSSASGSTSRSESSDSLMSPLSSTSESSRPTKPVEPSSGASSGLFSSAMRRFSEVFGAYGYGYTFGGDATPNGSYFRSTSVDRHSRSQRREPSAETPRSRKSLDVRSLLTRPVTTQPNLFASVPSSAPTVAPIYEAGPSTSTSSTRMDRSGTITAIKRSSTSSSCLDSLVPRMSSSTTMTTKTSVSSTPLDALATSPQRVVDGLPVEQSNEHALSTSPAQLTLADLVHPELSKSRRLSGSSTISTSSTASMSAIEFNTRSHFIRPASTKVPPSASSTTTSSETRSKRNVNGTTNNTSTSSRTSCTTTRVHVRRNRELTLGNSEIRGKLLLPEIVERPKKPVLGSLPPLSPPSASAMFTSTGPTNSLRLTRSQPPISRSSTALPAPGKYNTHSHSSTALNASTAPLYGLPGVSESGSTSGKQRRGSSVLGSVEEEDGEGVGDERSSSSSSASSKDGVEGREGKGVEVADASQPPVEDGLLYDEHGNALYPLLPRQPIWEVRIERFFEADEANIDGQAELPEPSIVQVLPAINDLPLAPFGGITSSSNPDIPSVYRRTHSDVFPGSTTITARGSMSNLGFGTTVRDDSPVRASAASSTSLAAATSTGRRGRPGSTYTPFSHIRSPKDIEVSKEILRELKRERGEWHGRSGWWVDKEVEVKVLPERKRLFVFDKP